MTKMTKKYRFCHFSSNASWGRENGTKKKRLIRPPNTDSEAGHFFVSCLVLPRFTLLILFASLCRKSPGSNLPRIPMPGIFPEYLGNPIFNRTGKMVTIYFRLPPLYDNAAQRKDYINIKSNPFIFSLCLCVRKLNFSAVFQCLSE